MAVSCLHYLFENLLTFLDHSRVVTYASVALAILKAFGFDDGGSLPL